MLKGRFIFIAFKKFGKRAFVGAKASRIYALWLNMWMLNWNENIARGVKEICNKQSVGDNRERMAVGGVVKGGGGCCEWWDEVLWNLITKLCIYNVPWIY